MDNKPYIISADNAQEILNWLANRGGLALSSSIDLEDPGFSVTMPARNADGSPVSKPQEKPCAF